MFLDKHILCIFMKNLSILVPQIQKNYAYIRKNMYDLSNFNNHKPISMAPLLFMPVSGILVTPYVNGHTTFERFHDL